MTIWMIIFFVDREKFRCSSETTFGLCISIFSPFRDHFDTSASENSRYLVIFGKITCFKVSKCSYAIWKYKNVFSELLASDEKNFFAPKIRFAHCLSFFLLVRNNF